MAEQKKRRDSAISSDGRPLSEAELTQRRAARQQRRALLASKRRFRRFFLIYTAIFLLLGGVGLAVLYRYMDAYEKGQGKHVMEEFLASHTDEDYLDILLSSPALELGEFEDNEALMRDYFEGSCRGEKYSYREAAGVSTSQSPVYTVKAGKYDVCRVTLAPAEELPFGFHRYRVEKCEPYISPYALQTTRIAIEAAEGDTVYLNGRVLSSDYITETDISRQLTPLEQRYTPPLRMVCYQVSGLYGDVTVTDAEGTETYPVEDGDWLLYRMGGEEGYSFTVTAPANARVFVCDTLLGEEEITRRDRDLLEGLDLYTQGESTAPVTYAVSGLSRLPDIRVEPCEGCTLEQAQSEDGSLVCRYRSDEALQAEMLERVSQFFDANMYYSAGNSGQFYNLLQRTLYGSELYSYFANSTAAMVWASNTTISYDYLTYDDFVPCGSDCFTCRVSYKARLHAQSWYETRDTVLEDAYDLAFVRSNGVWYAAAMAIVE